MFIDPAVDEKPAPLRFTPFKALVVPRPIGWVSTVGADGAVNLAPFSFFNGVTDNPPCVMFCPNGTHRDGGAKDSLANAEETGEFVCSLASWELREKMNATAAHLPRGVDEMAQAGLEPAPSVKVRPPRVAAAPAALECKYLQTVRLPDGRDGMKSQIVIGQVVGMHIADEIIVDGRVDIGRLQPVARLGYLDFAVVRDGFTMVRPD